MRKYLFLLPLPFVYLCSFAQKKPLDHSMYDQWQSIGERWISNNGRYVVYTVNPQEGDGTLEIQSTDGRYKKEIPRGYNATITADNVFVVFKIRPLFKENRDAKIKKKKPEDMPKDSLGIVELGRDSVLKVAGVKSYKMPEKAGGWLAYRAEKGFPMPPGGGAQPDSLAGLISLSRIADSLVRVADSLRNKAAEARLKGMNVLQPLRKEGKKNADENLEEGTDLVLRNLNTGEEKRYRLVSDYLFSRNGNRFLVETTKKNNDSVSKNYVLLVTLLANVTDTVMKNLNDADKYTFDERGEQLAFVAERDSAAFPDTFPVKYPLFCQPGIRGVRTGYMV